MSLVPVPLASKYSAFAAFCAYLHKSLAAIAHGSSSTHAVNEHDSKRHLALCLRNTVVGLTLSFILWQAWGAASDLASE